MDANGTRGCVRQEKHAPAHPSGPNDFEIFRSWEPSLWGPHRLHCLSSHYRPTIRCLPIDKLISHRTIIIVCVLYIQPKRKNKSWEISTKKARYLDWWIGKMTCASFATRIDRSERHEPRHHLLQARSNPRAPLLPLNVHQTKQNPRKI